MALTSVLGGILVPITLSTVRLGERLNMELEIEVNFNLVYYDTKNRLKNALKRMPKEKPGPIKMTNAQYESFQKNAQMLADAKPKQNTTQDSYIMQTSIMQNHLRTATHIINMAALEEFVMKDNELIPVKDKSEAQ